MFAGILAFFTSTLPGLFTGLFGYLNKKADVDLNKYTTGVQSDTTVAVAQIGAQVELAKVAASADAANKGWWVTAWMKPAAFYISLSHYAAVVFDSLPWFGHKVGSWGIPALPAQYASMEEKIILVCVGVIGLQKIVRAFK